MLRDFNKKATVPKPWNPCNAKIGTKYRFAKPIVIKNPAGEKHKKERRVVVRTGVLTSINGDFQFSVRGNNILHIPKKEKPTIV